MFFLRENISQCKRSGKVTRSHVRKKPKGPNFSSENIQNSGLRQPSILSTKLIGWAPFAAKAGFWVQVSRGMWPCVALQASNHAESYFSCAFGNISKWEQSFLNVSSLSLILNNGTISSRPYEDIGELALTLKPEEMLIKSSSPSIVLADKQILNESERKFPFYFSLEP